MALKWLKSYLNDRNIQVLFRNTLSNSYPLKYGAPQGSVLGPLIYSILANDMPRCLKFTNSVMFADDTTIFVTGKNLKFLYRKMNSDLSNLAHWFKNNSLSLNIDNQITYCSKLKTKNLILMELYALMGNRLKRLITRSSLGYTLMSI